MSKGQKVTSETIETICEEFGFPYELREGKHLATVDGEEEEVKFGSDGTLPPGRHRFMTKARESNEEFLATYPPTARRSTGSNPSTDGNSTTKLALGRQFLCKYSIPELEKAMELIGEIVDEKRTAEELAKGIEEREGKLAELREIVKGIKKHKLTSQEQIEGRIEEIETELKELKKK